MKKLMKLLLIAGVGYGLMFLAMRLILTPRTQAIHLWLLTLHGWGLNTLLLAACGGGLSLVQYLTTDRKRVFPSMLLVLNEAFVFTFILAFLPRTQALHFWLLALHGWGMYGWLPAALVAGVYGGLWLWLCRKRD